MPTPPKVPKTVGELPVVIPVKASPPKVIVTDGVANLPPDTTAAEDLVTSGQRRINVLWETTQAIVALMVTAATLWVSGNLALQGRGDTAAFLLLSNAFFVVISTYLTRTNHTKTGGVGHQQDKRRGE